MERRAHNLKILAIVFCVVLAVVPALLLLGYLYKVLSLRGVRIGMITYVAAMFLWWAALKRAAKKHLAAASEPRPALEDNARKRILWMIRMDKVWIGVLIAFLPLEVAALIAEYGWRLTVVGVGITLSLIYLRLWKIAKWRKLLDSDRR